MNDITRRQHAGLSLRVSAGMMLVALATAVGLTIWITRYPGLCTERALFWGLVLPWSAVARFPGAAIGGCLGTVARHAVGWFSAVIAGAATIVIFNFVQDPDLLGIFIRLRTGLFPPALIFGILAATIAETSLSMLETAGQAFPPDSARRT